MFPREQLHVLRYRELVDEPHATLDSICRFLGVEQGLVGTVPSENLKPFVAPSRRTAVLSGAIRVGAAAGAWVPPQIWRAASVPLVRGLQWGGGRRPVLSVEARRELVTAFVDDVARLEALTGDDFGDWLGDRGRGEYASRRADRDELTQVG